MMSDSLQVHRQLEHAGYLVSGHRESLGEEAPLTVVAVDPQSGERYTVTVSTQGKEGEYEALCLLADKLGVGVREDDTP